MASKRIDTHTHMIPPFWAEALAAKIGKPLWGTPEWSLDSAISVMDRLGTRVGIISLAAPSVVGWDGAERVEMARKVNDYGKDLVRQRPDRLGYFATVPLPDVSAAVAEIGRTFDVQGADGVLLLSSYNGVYLGDEAFKPVWDELERREAVVFIHPGNPELKPLPGVPQPVMDFPMDTTRTALSLVTGNVVERCPSVKVILSNAGGFLPYAATRFAVLLHAYALKDRSEEAIMEQLRRFYFDTALTAPDGMPSLMAFADPAHVVFGADNPYISSDVQALFSHKLDEAATLTPGQLAAINYENCEALFPRLKTVVD